jgi:4-amino-4-deoxy-L-arabinose transferase-like glycosyltransferase
MVLTKIEGLWIFMVLVVALMPVMLYKIAQSSLYSFDEAWYGEVAKQISVRGDWWIMHFNEQVFTDHPPVGFWIINLGQRVWGVNELGTRMGVVMCGVAGLVGVYLLGKLLFGEWVGWLAGLALLSSPWYEFRARSGNLDVILTAGMVWVIYLAFKASVDKRYFWVWVVITALVMLVKTAAPFAVIPALIIIFWRNKTISLQKMYLAVMIIVGTYGFWMYTNIKASPTFWTKYSMVAVPGAGERQNYWNNLLQIKTFVHHGIGDWFRPSVVALVVCGILGLFRKKYLVIAVMVASILGPMLVSERARLWHMIPAYPFLLVGLFSVLKLLTSWIPKRIGLVLVAVWALMTATALIKKNWYEFIDVNANVSDEQILSQKAGNLKGRLYIGENFLPAAVFYSNKQVERMYGSVDELYQAADSNYLLIAKESQLNEIKSDTTKFEVLAEDRDKKLVRLIKF